MIARALLFAGLLASSCHAVAALSVATWNIQRLGHNNQKSFPMLAKVISHTDFLAIQEVMTSQAVSKLEGEVEKATGESWSSMESDAIGRGSYKERYAFLWRDSKVAYEDGAVSYIDRRDVFEREPFSARFREIETNQAFAVGTVHILYGDGIEDRAPEIKALADYWEWMLSVYDNTPNLFLMGDFNLPPSDPNWAPLLRQAWPLVTAGGSTLSSRDGRFANLYDNIFVGAGNAPTVEQVFVLNYPKLLGWNHTKSRKHISDHAPVFMKVSLSESTSGGQVLTAGLQGAYAKDNTSNDQDLDQMIRGNSKSQIYHRPDCPSYNAIGRKNRVEFTSPEAAESAGYRLAGNCR